MRVQTDRLTPNQVAKRQQVVDAARAVLARDGLAGATVRAVAAESPLTKSAVHYYFADVDELVDVAMEAHVAAFTAHLRDVAADHRTPERRLWAVLEAYLASFEAQPAAAFLWFEYWIAATRRGQPQPVERMLAGVAALLGELLGDAGADDPPARARALVAQLLGVVVQQRVRPRPFAEVRPGLAAVCGPLPAG